MVSPSSPSPRRKGISDCDDAEIADTGAQWVEEPPAYLLGDPQMLGGHLATHIFLLSTNSLIPEACDPVSINDLIPITSLLAIPYCLGLSSLHADLKAETTKKKCSSISLTL